jgi:cell division protein FtsB
MSQRSEAVEREQRLIAERDAARKEAQDLRAQVDDVRAEMANLRRGVVLMMGGSLPSS